jgi:formylglycine-generating enzyme required for sulfatase activity
MESRAEPRVAPDRGGLTVFRGSIFDQPPRQVNGIVRPSKLEDSKMATNEQLPTRREFVKDAAIGALLAGLTVAAVDAGGTEVHSLKTQTDWAERLGIPVALTLDLGNSITLELVLVPPGKFVMGSPDHEADRAADEKPHAAELTRPYYLGALPVLQEQYTQVMKVPNPSWFCSAGAGRDQVKGLDTRRFPVEQVTWDEAMEFCTRLSTFWSGANFRLPTEVEWEYACRGGTQTPFYFGQSLNGTEANCDGSIPYATSSKGTNLARTCEAGKYASNAFGLYDMGGNVWEWCMDWYASYSANAQSPLGPETGTRRVCRGGGWFNSAKYCRAAVRDASGPARRDNDLGFRLALPLGDGLTNG